MPRGQTRKQAQPLTSRQQFDSTIKSVRDQLRKDAGLSGETDRLEQLTWMLFLKAVDDYDWAREEEYDEYEPVIDPPYRWHDWVSPDDLTSQRTGDELISFVNDQLFPHLATLSGARQQYLRSVVGRVFQGIYNRVRSGYILREVVDKLDTINLNSSDDVHMAAVFYERMLSEMRDAAGSSGEFYTPRPVIRFMIDRLDPRLGETVLDPACGTAGFLVEAHEHMKRDVRNPHDRERLQESLVGIEKKPLPYLLAVMNMMLHGVEEPRLYEQNTLSTNVTQIRDEERVDVIATNPPFGGEEERGILSNFPFWARTAETATLFVVYVMEKLKRTGARCAIVLPNGFLFAEGVETAVKERLLTRFNLHTIVRLPNGVFAPYTSIPTNLLFFESGEPTREVWYYDLPLPEGRKQYTKTKPLQYEEFAPVQEWWNDRQENERAWCVPVERLRENGYNLDLKNPNAAEPLEHLPPEQLAASTLEKEQRIAELMREIQQALAGAPR